MKIRSLLLGSVAAAGLSTGGFAADLDVLTSLDVCDQLGISGLTISSDTNCLAISGGVDYRARWGNYRGDITVARTYDGNVNLIAPDGRAPDELDYETRSRAFLQVVATANTDFGPAAAVLGLRQIDEVRFRNEADPALPVNGPGPAATNGGFGDSTGGVVIDEAYVRLGDSTVLMAGKRRHGTAGSVANIGDDVPFSFLYMSDNISGGGILIDANDRRLGNHSLQVTTDLGNGLSASAALENIDGQTGAGDAILNSQTLAGFYDADAAGTAVGVLQYAGEGVSAHVTGLAYGVLDGEVESFAVHAGASGKFENIQVRAAIAYDSRFKPTNFGGVNGYNGFTGAAAPGPTSAQDQAILVGLLTGQATFDIFTLSASGEFASFRNATDFDVSGQIGVTVTDGVTLNLLGVYFRDNHNNLDTARVQGSLAFAATETIGLTAALGTDFGSGVATADNQVIFGSIGATWKPGGDVDTSIVFEANDEGAYRTTVSAGKTFK